MIRMFEVRDSKDENLYSLDEMVEMYDEEPVNYSYVSKRLCCPHCGEKNIKIQIDENFERISSKRMSHQTWCDYYGQKIPQKALKKIIADPLKMLEVMQSNVINGKYFPKRSIERYLSADDFEIYKLFYGDVVVKTAYSKDESRYKNYSLKAPKGEAINISFNSDIFTSAAKVIETLDANINNIVSLKFVANLYDYDDYVNAKIEGAHLFKIEKVIKVSNEENEEGR